MTQSSVFTRFVEDFEIVAKLKIMVTTAVHDDLKIPDVRDLVLFAIERCNDARELLLNVNTSRDRENSPSVSGGDGDDAQARKRRAAVAANRRHKIVAQMSRMQSKFAKDNADDLENMDTTPTPMSGESTASGFFPDQGLPVAVGVKRTLPIIGDSSKYVGTLN